MLFAVKWAALIPMATLVEILVIVAYNMREWKSFQSILRGPRNDMAILLTTFLLTVLVDLTAAIEIGMALAAFLFMQKMISFSGVNILSRAGNEPNDVNVEMMDANLNPERVEVFEITGPLFFGAVHKFKDAMKLIEKPPAILIIRMRQVPIIDATGIKTLQEVHREFKIRHTKIILSEVNNYQVLKEIKDSRLMFAIGKANITASFPDALDRSRIILSDLSYTGRKKKQINHRTTSIDNLQLLDYIVIILPGDGDNILANCQMIFDNIIDIKHRHSIGSLRFDKDIRGKFFHCPGEGCSYEVMGIIHKIYFGIVFFRADKHYIERVNFLQRFFLPNEYGFQHVLGDLGFGLLNIKQRPQIFKQPGVVT
jgi:anti-anti-sigma regulatory factor